MLSAHIRRHAGLLVSGLCCAALGAGVVAFIDANSASGQTTTAAVKTAATAGPRASAAGGRSAGRVRLLRRLLALGRRTVHGQLVVATTDGFATVTIDRGRVQSVAGQQLEIVEGTARRTYRTVTLTIPASAIVRVDRRRSTLAGVAPGQRVIVVQGPRRTVVIARGGPARA
ncbi:MAG TPA: hypothetical protein VKV27_04470 [Solirubrobacteraceae bacterium]|nr:hypothetical protein [Solirubrobacteraceae bacterium]